MISLEERKYNLYNNEGELLRAVTFKEGYGLLGIYNDWYMINVDTGTKITRTTD